jgi:nucleosome binding factor SPN SPT16 subunit
MPVSKETISKKLIENDLALQKKTTELILSISKLTKRMDRMVDLFEEAAKYIKAGTDQPLMRKLDDLLEQNKNIARGLILLERYVKERTEFTAPKPLPRSEL